MSDMIPLTNGFARWEPCLGQAATNGATVAGSPPNSGISGDRQRHAFWEDDLSLIGSDLVNVDQIMTPGQITDTYLLALAVANKGQWATLDRRLSTNAIRHSKAALHIIGGGR